RAARGRRDGSIALRFGVASPIGDQRNRIWRTPPSRGGLARRGLRQRGRPSRDRFRPPPQRTPPPPAGPPGEASSYRLPELGRTPEGMPPRCRRLDETCFASAPT